MYIMKPMLFILLLPLLAGCQSVEFYPENLNPFRPAVESHPQSAQEDYKERVELGMDVAHHRWNHMYRMQSQNDIFTRERDVESSRTIVRPNGSTVSLWSFIGTAKDTRWKHEQYFDAKAGIWKSYPNEAAYNNRNRNK